MSEEGRLKRERFYAENPDIAEMVEEIRRENEGPGDGVTLRKLEDIKRHALRNCPLYRGMSASDEFPVLTKVDFIEKANLIRAEGGFSSPVHVSSTSGSTGTPFRVEQDRVKRRRTIADLKVFGEYALYPSHERMLQLRSYNGRTLDREVDRRENIWRWDVSSLGEGALDRIVDFIAEWRPTIVFGYTSTLEALARHLGPDGGFGLGVKSVLVGAETLSDGAAELITQAFGCPLFDRYSNMEMGIYAQREWGRGGFRINKSSYYVEVLKDGCDEPAPEGEVGRIVVTDLYNRVFPMIRYDTGDLGSIGRDARGERELACVYGRRVDSIYDATGVLINPHGITNGMWGIRGIRQWQFAQVGEVDYEVRVCPEETGFDAREVVERLLPVLGSGARVSVLTVGGIPVLQSGKRKYIVSEFNASA